MTFSFAPSGLAVGWRGVTVLEVIQKSAGFLEKKGVESPRLQSELLLAHVLGLPRLQLYLAFERTLGASDLEKMRELVRRRSQREPLQHLLGTTSFCGFDILVNADALVPRPETELLAERAWQYLAALGAAPVSALDFGTGTGCIAIAVARHCAAAQCLATDVSAAALELAKTNAARNGVAERIRFHLGDGLAGVPLQERFDLLVSNPPYIPSAEIATLPPEVRDHEPRLALDGGADGLEFHRRLAAEAPPFLKPGAKIMLELGAGQAQAVCGLFEQQKWVVETVESDYNKIPRVLVAHLSHG